MKIELLIEKQIGKHLRAPGFRRTVTKDAGEKLVETGDWIEVGAQSFDLELPRSKDNQRPIEEEEE